ncbi:MAG: DMT family transporter [Clostridia bacterium]|nr:DMT family transporter [Clostridia bacterium]
MNENKTGNKRFIGPIFCITAAAIWGLSFVAQKTGAHIGTFTFNGIRTLIGGIFLLPFVPVFHKSAVKNYPPERSRKFDYRATAISGIICGVVLCIASNLQQHAFSFDIFAAKVGFITALYMILVPIAGLFFGRKAGLNVWIAVVLGVIGLYFLCMKKGDFKVGPGEIFSIFCAVGFAAHILVIDHFCVKTEPVALACTQFLTAGVLSVICMLIFEKPQLSEIIDCAVPILYTGIASTGIAFTLQIFGQKYTEPAVASLLMCLESVFSVIFGRIILHDIMGPRALLGCAIMFAGVIMSQIPFRNKKSSGEKV